MRGLSSSTDVIVECDRGVAIETAIFKASPGDIVLIAGKGHEDYQILGGETIKFDDKKVAEKALYKKLNS